MHQIILENLTVVRETDYVIIEYSSGYKLMKFTWKGNVSGPQYREAFLTGLKYADTHRVDYFLSDIRKQKIVGPNERKWFEDVALPMAIERGLKKGCAIFDGNIFKKYYLNHIFTRTRKFELPFLFFKDEKSALEWLID